MRSRLRFLYYFLLPVAAGASLKCEDCHGPGKDCNGSSKTCPADKDICYTGYAEETLDGNLSQYAAKECQSSELCSLGPVHLHVSNDRYYNARYACCPWNNCKNIFPPLELLPIDNETKTVECPACYSWTGKCGRDIVYCTEKEKHCFTLYSNVLINGTVKLNIMKGCTSRDVCEAMERGFFAMIRKDIKKMHCPLGIVSKAQLFGLLLPSFFGLLLLKIIL